MLKLFFDAISKFLNRFFFGEVKGEVFDVSAGGGPGRADILDSLNAFLLISATNDDVVAISVEPSCSFKPYA